MPQEIEAVGGEAATMTMTRVPMFLRETEVHYEKADDPRDFLELKQTSRGAHSVDSKTADSEA